MYYKYTYDAKTSIINRDILKSTVFPFNDDKENKYQTFHTRMQENRKPKCSGCSHCGKNLHAQPSSAQTNFCLNQEWYEYPLKENYCTDCSRKKRNQNVGNCYANEDKSKHCDIPENMQDYVTVFNTRRTYKSTDSHAKGSMYSCDQINVKDVPLYKDVTKRKGKGTMSSNDKVGNYAASKTQSLNTSEQSQDDIEKRSCAVGQSEIGRMSGIEQIESCGSYHKIDDISCSVDLNSGSVSHSKATTENRYSTSGKFTNREAKSNLEKDKVVGVENSCFRSANKKYEQNDNSECKSYVPEAKSKSSQKLTDNGRGKSNAGKHKTIIPDLLQRADTDEKDTDVENTDKSEHLRNVKTESDEAPKPAANSGRDRPKVPRGTKRMTRRRAQKKPQANIQPNCDSKKTETGGIDEWLLFIFHSIKQGMISFWSKIPSYLSIGWSLLVYFLQVFILLLLPALLCIWSLLKSCFVNLWNGFWYLATCISSIRNVFKKREQYPHDDTSKQEPSRPANRQRSDSLPEASELVSKLLASKNLDAYDVLDVSPLSTDEEIKRKYRDMAKVVHPDKNPHEDASEAFQILQSAFESIGDEEKRKAYELDNNKKRFEEEMDEFFENFMERINQMKNKIMCRVCQNSHPRLPTDRLAFAARYCSECGVKHPAKDGDVWVETSHLGFKYYCFLCMDGRVYEVTEWGACQGLLRMRPNSHTVYMSVRSNNYSPWDDMSGDADRSSSNKKKRKSKAKTNKNKKR
ncbi:uncharacterized protein LOC114527282 [Dendronephthya gigantea]|uniref:uncharacterized protein LOC114527282 n=1 Tax=Dendronephthya gigantea TaxID=151771 RepID=UPI00106B99E9|nr:uncharacterized protein LOC114527282 [Dendronephthya gigantea]